MFVHDVVVTDGMQLFFLACFAVELTQEVQPLGCRYAQREITEPSFIAANSVVVPCRL